MSENITILFGLVGGLALFLYGMNSMSDHLQKVAGDRMRKILGILTRNPFLGALAGALVTAVLQSSSATTVMAIGFVSAGLMTLPQAISVIFGANIGTTMTAQLMAFRISDYIYPILFIGFLMYFAGKKERLKNIGMVVFSFGLLFEGIEIMGGVMKPLAGSPVFTEWMAQVSELPALGVLLGACMTLVVQSSSATIAVLQNFASQAGPDGVTSVIGLAGAIPILLGDNIGTTITALLASVGQSKNAKRTALAHSFFNISGAVVFVNLIPAFTRFVQWLSPKGAEVEVISRQIANAHTTFNVICTLIWLPLIPLMVRLVSAVISGDENRRSGKSDPKFLDENMLGQPLAAMYLISKETERCAGFAFGLLSFVQQALTGEHSEAAEKQMDEDYGTAKMLQSSIVSYVSRLFARGGLTGAQAEQTAGILSVVNNIERFTDRCGEISAIARQISDAGKTLSEEARAELLECFTIAGNLFEKAILAIDFGDMAAAEQVEKDRDLMRKAQKKFNKAHLARVKEKSCDASLTADYAGILYSLDRMVDNCVAIAETAMEQVRFVRMEESGMREQLFSAVK